MRMSRGSRRVLATGAATAAFALVGLTVVAPPPPPTQQAEFDAYLDQNAQTLVVSSDVGAPATTARDAFSATAGIQTLALSGTNYDWAKLVLLYAEWPLSDTNVTVFVRWMRQENGTDDWWNRNNPLNNGWGSGGGGGTGTYANLDIAAQNAAEALRTNMGYAGIAAAFATSAPTATIEQAIWASPWATSHYANGTHWSSREVPAVKSPAGTW